jgi:hypothetical protein
MTYSVLTFLLIRKLLYQKFVNWLAYVDQQSSYLYTQGICESSGIDLLTNTHKILKIQRRKDKEKKPSVLDGHGTQR